MVTYLTGCTACGTVNLVKDRKLGPPSATPIDHEWQSASRFVAQRCDIAADVRIESKTLVDAYRAWCEEQGADPLPNQTIGRAICALFGVERIRSNGKRYWVGITLKQ